MKRAFLAAVNNYVPFDPSGGANLRGCLSDQASWHAVLVALGWLERDIHTLKDAQVTRENFLAECAWLVKDAQPGDQLFLGYSGHGSYVNVPGVGVRPIICYCGKDVFARPLTFKDLGAVLQIPEGVALTAVMDCCHSGARMREMGCQPTNERQSRYLEPRPEDLENPTTPIFAEDLKPEVAALMKDLDPEHRRIVSNNFTVALTGCTLQQTSADAFIGGQYRGAFSAYTVDVLKSFGYSLSYATLIAKVNQVLKAHGYAQSSQFEGDANYASLKFMQVPVVTSADDQPDAQPAPKDGDAPSVPADAEVVPESVV